MDFEDGDDDDGSDSGDDGDGDGNGEGDADDEMAEAMEAAGQFNDEDGDDDEDDDGDEHGDPGLDDMEEDMDLVAEVGSGNASNLFTRKSVRPLQIIISYIWTVIFDAGTQDADNDPGDVANAEMANDIDQNNGMGQIDDQDLISIFSYI